MGQNEKVEKETIPDENKGEKEKVPLEGAAAAANRRSPSPTESNKTVVYVEPRGQAELILFAKKTDGD